MIKVFSRHIPEQWVLLKQIENDKCSTIQNLRAYFDAKAEWVDGAPFIRFKPEQGRLVSVMGFPISLSAPKPPSAVVYFPSRWVLSLTFPGTDLSLGPAWEAIFDLIEKERIQVCEERFEIYHHFFRNGKDRLFELQVPLISLPEQKTYSIFLVNNGGCK